MSPLQRDYQAYIFSDTDIINFFLSATIKFRTIESQIGLLSCTRKEYIIKHIDEYFSYRLDAVYTERQLMCDLNAEQILKDSLSSKNSSMVRKFHTALLRHKRHSYMSL